MEKDFDGWGKIKKDIHRNQPNRFAYCGQIWWASLGVNIGSEVDGKNYHFERPVIILKVFNASMILVVPLTTQNKKSPYHVTITHPDGFFSQVNFSQIRVMSSKRLLRKINKVSLEEFQRLIVLFKNIIP